MGFFWAEWGAGGGFSGSEEDGEGLGGMFFWVFFGLSFWGGGGKRTGVGLGSGFGDEVLVCD